MVCKNNWISHKQLGFLSNASLMMNVINWSEIVSQMTNPKNVRKIIGLERASQ